MVVQYQQFVDGVMARADLDTAERARDAAVDVLQHVALRLDEVDRRQLATVVPPKIRDGVDWDGATREGANLLDDVAASSGETVERARYLVGGVLSELRVEETALAESLRHRLPDEFAPLFSAPGGGPPPHWGTAGSDDRPRPLDATELARALDDLVDWSGDTRKISRTVSLPRDRWNPLLNRIEAVQQELSHHADIDRGEQDVITFGVRTRSIDAVTELDLRLARRIDEAVNEVGSGG